MSDFQSPQQLTVDSEYDGQRLDNFLHRVLQRAPKSLVYRIIRRGEVRINGSRAKPDRRLRQGDKVRVPPVRLDESSAGTIPGHQIDLLRRSILAENDDYLVLNKPAGMAVHGGSGLSWGLIDAVRQLRPDQFVELAHRLDRFTSGCLLLARNGAALRQANRWFADGAIAKSYLCVLSGPMRKPRVVRSDPLQRVSAGDGRREVRVDEQGKTARTEFLRLATSSRASLVRAEISTGRTHQIRVHAQAMGRPIVGDDKYASDDSRALARALEVRHMLLHSYRLDLPPEAALGVTAPVPDPWVGLLDELFNAREWRAELQLQ